MLLQTSSSLDTAHALLAGVVVLLSTAVYLVVARLILSPIAKFPGPKLAALTFWYEFYYDVIQGGRYTWKIAELHEKYGPVVRINPEELHVSDPEFYPKLYTGSAERRDKWPWSMKLFGATGATFATCPHDQHRRRRAALNPLFSKAAVARFEGEIQGYINRLCERLGEFKKSGKPAELGVIYSALTGDIITKYAFGNSYNTLEDPEFNPKMYHAIQANTKTTVVAKQYGWALPLARSLPIWTVKIMNPLMMQMIEFAGYIAGECQAVVNSNLEKAPPPKHATVFHSILEADLDPADKTIPRLMDEGISVVGAGLSTTADTLRITTFHILNRPEVLSKLRAELLTAMPNPTDCPSLRDLEQLPYLSAVVNEGFRIACGICSRLQRISPLSPLKLNSQWTIPAGVPISMTIYLLHNDPNVFPEPEAFRPERWLNDPKGPDGGRLDRYLVQFSKGTRACVGMTLAQSEIYLTLAYVFRRIDMQLYKTDRSDVDIKHDYFTSFPRLDSEGVRVLVK